VAHIQNDGRFPDGSAVRVRSPAPGADDHDRETWPLLPGHVLGQCAADKWHVAIEVRELATLEDGSSASEDTPEDQLRYPEVYCDSSAIMVVSESDRQA
jgi:hypothetical protein